MRHWVLPLLLLGLMDSAAAHAQMMVTHAPSADVRKRVLELVNQARREGRRCGQEHFAPAMPLVDSAPLQHAARGHARDMASKGFFDHRAPDGSQPRDRARLMGYQSSLTGENIAFGPESAEEVVAGWLASPGHCANIMDPRFRDSGIAFAIGGKRGHIYWVQQFGSPAARSP